MAKRKCTSWKMTRAGRRCASYGDASSTAETQVRQAERLAAEWASLGMGWEGIIGTWIADVIAQGRYDGKPAGDLVNDIVYELERLAEVTDQFRAQVLK